MSDDYSAFTPVDDYSAFTPVTVAKAAAPQAKPAKPRSNFERFTGNFGDAIERSGIGQLSRSIQRGDDGLGYVDVQPGGLLDRGLDAVFGNDRPILPGKDRGVHPVDAREKERRKQFETRSQADPFYKAPGGVVGKAVAGASTLAGQFGGAALSPENWVSPGRTLGQKVVGNAAVGGGADVLLQGGDIGAGAQDEYNPYQTIGATLISGALPVAGAGASAVVRSKPVQAVLPDRLKMKPTEPAAPAFRSQVGQQSNVNTPELIAKQKDVFSRGTSDDINAFYDEVGGQRPSQETIDNWLQRREGITGAIAAPKPEVIARQAHRDSIKAHIDNETKQWKNKPTVNIIDSLDEMDPETRLTADRDGITPENTVGFLGPDGKVHIFANQVKTPEAANAVLFHEALGHFGLAQRFGTKLDSTLQTLVARNVGQFGKKVDKWLADNPGAYGGNKLRAAEEVLAEMSQSGPLPKSIGDAVVAVIRDFARNRGIQLKYSDAEVKHILAMAHDAVINGKGRDVIGNRFGGLNNAKADYQATDFGQQAEARQMYAGVEANNWPPGSEWFVGPDGGRRFEISDHEAQWDEWHSYSKPEGVDLDEVLIHPTLFKAYPELRNTKVIRDVSEVGDANSIQGFFNPNTGTLHISPKAMDPRSTALHEIQHWIQYKENFAFGGSRDTVRLDNKNALKKLEKFYTRKLAEMSEEPAIGWTNAGPSNQLKEKLKSVKDLQEGAESLTEIYKIIDDLQAKYNLAKSQTAKLREQFTNFKLGVTGDYQAFTNLNQKYLDSVTVRTNIAKKLRKVSDSVTGISSKHGDLTFDLYNLLTGEVEARDVQARMHFTPEERKAEAPFSSQGINQDEMIHTRFNSLEAPHSLGREQVDPNLLGEVDQLKADPRFWSDPEYRKNVIELARSKTPAAIGPEESSIPAVTGITEAEYRNRQMTPKQFDADGELPFTSRDVIRARRLRGELGRSDQFGQALKGEERTAAEDRLARIYGDAIEEMDNVSKAWKEQRAPLVPTHINVYDNRTGEVVGTFEGRDEAFEFIDAQGPDGQFLGINRVGTKNRYMTPEQLQRQIDEGATDIERLERTYEGVYKDYEPTYRSDAEVRRAAINAGMQPGQVKKLKDMEDLSARIFRGQEAAKILDDRLAALAAKEGTPEWSAKDADNSRKIIADHYAILQRLWDDKSELGRALRISKLGYTHAEMRAYKELLADEGGTLSPLSDDETLNRFLRSYKALAAGGGNPNGVNALIMGLKKPNWEEYLLSARVNMMLSGMSTHVTAVTDMIDGIGLDLMDSTAGLIPSLGREGLRALGLPVKPGIHPAEVGARYWGVLRAAMEASTWVNALKTLKEGSSRHTTGGRQFAKIPILGKVGDLIAAEDQFFRAFATNMHLYGLGVRKAVEEARAAGKKPSMDDLISQGASYARNPDAAMLKQAERASEENLLLAPNRFVTGLEAMRQRLNTDTGGNTKASDAAQRALSFLVNFQFPFVRTAANSLYQRIWRRTPLTVFDPHTLADLREGGVKADIAMGRVMLGAASVFIAWSAAEQGIVSGDGPDNPHKRALKMAGGWRPKSVKVEGEGGEPDRYNINQNLGNRLNPFDLNNQTATLVASMREAFEKGANEGQVATGMRMAVYSAIKNLAENAWLGDIAKDIETFSKPGEYGTERRDQWIADQITSFVPNLSGQIARTRDQGQPMTTVRGDFGETLANTFKAKIPGLREELPDRMTPLGKPVQSGATLAGQSTILPQGNRVTGGAFIEATDDLAEQEILRLDDMFEETLVTSVRRNFKMDGKPVKLTNEQFSEYQELAGREIVETLRDQMGTEEWAGMDDESRAGWIKKMQLDAKKRVREYLYSGGEND